MIRTSRSLFAVLPLTLALAGCESSGGWDSVNNLSDRFQDALHDFNPFGTSKKPLPGERRAVFPEGVPGVQQGVPSELMRGAQPADDAPPRPGPDPQASKSKTKKAAAKAKTRAPAEQSSSDPAEDEVWPPPPRR